MNYPQIDKGVLIKLLTQSYLSLYSDTRNERIFQLADWSVAGMRAVMTDGGQESRASTAPIPSLINPHSPCQPQSSGLQMTKWGK